MGLNSRIVFKGLMNDAPVKSAEWLQFNDIAPANELRLPSIWINRLGEPPGPRPTRELPDLDRLADTLAELA